MNSFSFDTWILENNLSEIKRFFVEHEATTLPTLHLKSRQLHAVMTDPDLLQNHVTKIPLIMIAIQSCYQHSSRLVTLPKKKPVINGESTKISTGAEEPAAGPILVPFNLKELEEPKKVAEVGKDRPEHKAKAKGEAKDKGGLPVCRFFGSEMGCTMGMSCQFSHADPNMVPLCKYYQPSWNAGCKYGEGCKFRHRDWTGMGEQKKKYRSLMSKGTVSDSPPLRGDVPKEKAIAEMKNEGCFEVDDDLIMLD